MADTYPRHYNRRAQYTRKADVVVRPNGKKDIFQRLPTELQVATLEHLTYQDAIKLSQVDHRCNDLVKRRASLWPEGERPDFLFAAQKWRRHYRPITTRDGTLLRLSERVNLAYTTCFRILPRRHFSTRQSTWWKRCRVRSDASARVSHAASPKASFGQVAN